MKVYSLVTVIYGVTLQLVLLNVSHGAPNQKSCSETIENKQSGEISSPNFPSVYQRGDSCVWSFKLKDTEVVEVTFDAFMLEASNFCLNAFIEIVPNSLTSKKGEKFCGKRDPFTVTLKGPQSSIKFVSNSETGYPGFHAKFVVVEQSVPTHGLTPKGVGHLKSNVVSSAINDTCKCGQSSRQGKRIVGGSASDLNEYPWLVVLVIRDSSTSAHCGAALITTKHLITASHCTNHQEAVNFLALLGAHNLLSRGSETVVRNIVAIHRHENYNRNNENNDIAILVMDHEVTLNNAVQPICLPPLDEMFIGETAVAAGWGKTNYGGKNSDIPLEVRMPVVDNKKCQEKFSATKAIITDQNLCAGVLNGEKDACQGDSGGPLMWQNQTTNQWHLIGIVSFGVKCATPGFYGVYTRVNKYTDWIANVTNEINCQN